MDSDAAGARTVANDGMNAMGRTSEILRCAQEDTSFDGEHVEHVERD
jgi:hypothetical protein